MSHDPMYPRILPRHRRAVAPIVVLAAATFVPLAACGGDDATSGDATGSGAAATATADASADRPAYGLVTPAQAAALAADAGVTVLDVRTPAEFAEGHIEGATNVDFESASFASEVAKLDPSKPYLVYCRSGNRSGQAVAQMAGLGFANLWDLNGGIINWTADGRELVT